MQFLVKQDKFIVIRYFVIDNSEPGPNKTNPDSELVTRVYPSDHSGIDLLILGFPDCP